MFHAPVSSMPALKMPNNAWVVGSEVMHPAMRRKLSGEPASVEAAAKPKARAGKSGLLGELEQVAGKSLSALSELWGAFRYGRMVGEMRAGIKEHLSSDEIVRFVYDAKGWSRIPPGMDAARIEEGEVSEIPEVNAAYENSGVVFDFFKEHLGVVLPQPLVQVVNYKQNVLFTAYENAFYTPMMLGAHLVVYGKGDDRLYRSPAHAIDIVGHEFTHFFLETVYPEKFPYSGQSGALNEHIADVVGTCVKAKAKKIDSNKYPEGFWRLGAEWMIQEDVAVRDMLHPGKGFNHPDYGTDQQPAHMRGFAVMTEDEGGVHYNSGIMNRLFALFAKSVDSPCYDVPLKVWLEAIKTVKRQPSFRDFAETLIVVAKSFDEYPQMQGKDLEDKMRAAVKKVGVLDYVVVNGEVIKADDLQKSA